MRGHRTKRMPKKTYTKSTWIPSKTEDHIELSLHNFIKEIQQTKDIINRRNKQSINLTVLQQQQLKMLKTDKQYIILMADKNLGPCIMERRIYIKISFTNTLAMVTHIHI